MKSCSLSLFPLPSKGYQHANIIVQICHLVSIVDKLLIKAMSMPVRLGGAMWRRSLSMVMNEQSIKELVN